MCDSYNCLPHFIILSSRLGPISFCVASKETKGIMGFTFIKEVLKVLVSYIFQTICVSEPALEKEHHNDENLI